MKPTNIQIQKAGAQTNILTMAYLPLLIWSVRRIVNPAEALSSPESH